MHLPSLNLRCTSANYAKTEQLPSRPLPSPALLFRALFLSVCTCSLAYVFDWKITIKLSY